jgi:hypothetical protein
MEFEDAFRLLSVCFVRSWNDGLANRLTWYIGDGVIKAHGIQQPTGYLVTIIGGGGVFEGELARRLWSLGKVVL